LTVCAAVTNARQGKPTRKDHHDALEHRRAAPRRKRTWSVDGFRAFWSSPEPAIVPEVLTDHVIGHWAGRDEPVRGPDDHTRCIAALVTALPDVRLEVAEHAHSGEFTFVRWIMYASGRRGPFQLTGIDRIRQRDGQVAENVIVFDTNTFERRARISVPWGSP
jgi:SnoaL-like polyketide cyclase